MRFLSISLILLFLLGNASGTQASDEHGLRAGAAAVEISPETLPALCNGGFLQRTMNRIADPLYARSLVLSDGNETIAIVAVDSCMFPTELCDEIKRIAAQQTGIPCNRILITATHTHSAPSAMEMCLGCDADEAYVKYVPARVAQAIADAHARLEPAMVGWAIADGSDLTNCRRWITRSDRMGFDPFGQQTVRAMMHPGYRNPDYASPAGPIDPWLSVLSVASAQDESPICVLANLSMHYFGAGNGFSADYFGDVARLLEHRIAKANGESAAEFVGIMSQGTSGDLHWMDYSGPQRDVTRQQYSEDVADRVHQAWKTIEHRRDLPLAMAEQRLVIERRAPSRERREWARPINARRGEHPPRDQVEVYAQQAEWLHEHPAAEVVLQAVRIGELGITAMPTETYGITGLKIKRQSPLAATFNLELANGAVGYIPPPEQHRLGGYTTWPARTAGLSEQAEPQIVEALLGLLETVAGRERRPLVAPDTPYSRAVARLNPLAYWRLDDMNSTRVEDAVGANDGQYHGGVALFLPGPEGHGFAAEEYGNRSVYLAGGYLEADLSPARDQHALTMWFRNVLPADARATTGVLAARGDDALSIAGSSVGDRAGTLQLRSGDQVFSGKIPVATGQWQQITITCNSGRVRVHLNGCAEPEIDAVRVSPKRSARWLIGSDGTSPETFDGQVDEVAVFDRALSAADMAELYAASGMTPPPPSAPLDAPAPLEAEQSLRAIHVPEGFAVQLVAAEPLVQDPVAIDWGPDGKLWVVEMADYPLGLDGQGQPGGRVRFLEDADGDGKYDKSTLFAEGLSFPTGILAWGRGVLVTAAPEILYLEDSSGDGQADVRRSLYSGFLEGNQQLRVNGLRWGLDNWVYCASGSHHGGYGKDSLITAHQTGSRIQLGSRDFRIRPDTGAIDPQSGPSQYGRNRDDWGNWFGVQNSQPLWHYVLADHDIRRNPHFAPPDPKHQVVTPSNPPVYPASKLEKRFHSFEQSGRFTSACSAMIYRDDYLFAPGSEQHAFTCEPFHNLVQHNLISDAGVSFAFRRDPAEQEIDFFASEDRWCRPVMVRTGPDGALWVVDMVRYMIEHPEWLPQEGQDELRPWYRAGEDRGRIYRVVRSDRPPRGIPRLADLPTEELVEALASPSGWQRDTAQRLLVRGQGRTVVEQLDAALKNGAEPLARLHALWTLQGLAALSPPALEAVLCDPHPGVRRNAVQVAAENKVDVRRLAAMVDDTDAKVRLALACTLGAYDAPEAAAALAKLAVGAGDDPYVAAAVMTSLNANNVADVLAGAMRIAADHDADVATDLIGQAVALCDRDEIGRVIEAVAKSENETAAKRRFAALAQILGGLVSRDWSVDQLPETARARIAATTQQAREMAGSEAAADDARIAAVGLLGWDDDRRADDFQFMQELLVPQTPAELQRAVVEQLARRSEPSVANVLLASWRSHSPELRQQILEVLASRASWAESLRESLEAGRVRAGELNASLRQRLLEGSDGASEWRSALAAQDSTDRAAVLSKFKPALELKGNAARGEAIFRKACLHCHQLGDEGYEVGPQLASVTDKSQAAIFHAVLDPSASVDARYYSYVVVSSDGRTFAGQIATETGSSITLLAAGGKRETILRRDIEELHASTKSLMPEGLEEGLTPQDLADLIDFVRETFR